MQVSSFPSGQHQTADLFVGTTAKEKNVLKTLLAQCEFIADMKHKNVAT